MVSLADYAGREQSYVKHVFLERYLEALIFKTASAYDHIVYVDGFAGPWQSASEQFEDTSFGIALNALRRAKAAWKKNDRNVRMTALLVERDAAAYERLATIRPKYPDIEIKPYHADFLSIVPELVKDIPSGAFAFFLIDPKGWRIPLDDLRPLLARPKSEVTFNFMFEFINRAASMTEPAIVQGLDELMPYGNWRQRLRDAQERQGGPLTSEEREQILVDAFKENLRQVGGYEYVADTPVLRPLRDRTLYCLFYATRHERGIAAFRDCQGTALAAQSTTRAAGKIRHAESSSGQSELFDSLHDMAPDKMADRLEHERGMAEATIMELVPAQPESIAYLKLWPHVLARHMVRLTDVNVICGRLRKEGRLLFPDWELLKRVPKDHYRVQRP
ncbi:MAG TPA: three-Cys-motif partner protein TcmP [Pseudolabrys sp.]|nr:three-Cys-motif partner protein TcmP [Pseudolabrys sp.]